MSHAERCPVCAGTGKVKAERCHGCGGSGWVTVQDSVYPPPLRPPKPVKPMGLGDWHRFGTVSVPRLSAAELIEQSGQPNMLEGRTLMLRTGAAHG